MTDYTDVGNNDGNTSTSTNNSRAEVHISDKGRAALITFNAVATIVALIAAFWFERECRMLEYYVTDVDTRLVALGIVKPEDTWAAKQREKLK